jgi:predicted amidohydrolase YtcJ
MKKIGFLLLLVHFQIAAQKTAVDLIIHNAKIYTVNEKFETATGMAIHDGLILEVGDSKKILEQYASKKIVDAGKKSIYPGFYDPHSHFVGLGEMLYQCDLVGTNSFEEILGRLEKYHKEFPDRKWIVGRGWDQNDWKVKSFPTKDQLDQLFPDLPVMLVRIDGHALLANNKALQMAKISPSTTVAGGEIEKLDGQLTGILVDNAMGLVKRIYPKPDENERKEMILAAQKECLKYGLTTVSDAGISQDDIELIDKMHQEGSLKIRDYAMVSIGIRNVEYFTKKGIIKTDRLNVRSFKLYADGALGSRGASLLKPYSDAKDNYGLMLLSKKEMDTYLSQIFASDYQANTHCIGDSANRLVLDLYGKYLKSKNNRRWRIEHCQVVNPADVPKFGKYSVIPSIQATHATSDMYWAEARLGKERVKHAYPFESLRKQNGLLANGSDFPVEHVNPLYGFHAAVARQDDKNWPKGGFQIENALSRKDALKAMTLWSAYANFEEKERGSLEKGKMADFVILDADILTIPLPSIRNTKVLATYIGGEKVF